MRIDRFRIAIGPWLLLVLLGLPLSAEAQNGATESFVRTQTFRLDSRLMKREMPYRVILPVGYDAPGNNAKKYPTLYLLHGLTGNFRNWSDMARLEKHSKDYGYLIVMPEGDNGWYTDSGMIPNAKYESYIIRELIKEIENKFRVKTNRESRAIAGLSMGGFGALKFAVKYPEKFVIAGSFSGALRAAEWTSKELLSTRSRVLIVSISSAFGKAESAARKRNDLFSIVRNKNAEDIKALPFLYLDCGTEDFLVMENRKFATLLLTKKAAHEFRQLPGRHDWKFWDSQIQEFLNVSKRFVK
ncbi:MAG: esterase family protein [Pyrinomonadaceae bacterium]|nr:esterase family protein [Pyrinomonadaceae bacterium]